MRLGALRRCEPALQLFAHAFVLAVGVLPFAEALRGVLCRHVEQARLVAALRPQHRHAAPLALAEVLAADLRVVQVVRDQDLLRDVALALIELRQQRARAPPRPANSKSSKL